MSNLIEKCNFILGIDLSKEAKENYTLKEEDGLLELKLTFNYKRYKNKISAYSETLKKYFAHDKIYVLSRIKVHKGFQNILTILFKNSRSAVMNQIKSFVPYYLVVHQNRRLLVAIENECLFVNELSIEEDSVFEYRGYRFKKANLLKLK